jgi:exodeoxyribonuclease-3
VRAQLKDLSGFFFEIPVFDSPLKATYYFSKKPGYSGVGIFSKKKPTQFFSGIGVNEFDDEGRVLRLDFDNQYELFPLMSTVSVYFPSGSASESRQESKNRFLLSFMKVLKKWEIEYRETGRQFLLCGDWNIAHNEIDLKNWKQNKNNSGFLPWERNGYLRFLNQFGLIIYENFCQKTKYIPGGVKGVVLAKITWDGELIIKLLQKNWQHE